MSLKIPLNTLIKLEEKRLIHKISKELGFEYEYKKGIRLVLVHNDQDILNLASDTLHFWVIPPPDSKSSFVTLLEDKKVVWKFHGDYARKAVLLFERDLTPDNLGTVEVKMNNREKKNVSQLEIFCEYDDFAIVNPKINDICRNIEALVEKQIVVKSSDIIKVRQFVHQKIDDDRNVLCIFKEKELKLEIFGKSEEAVDRVEREIKGQFKRAGGDNTNTQSPGQSQTTTVYRTTANSTHVPMASINEPRTANSADLLKGKFDIDSKRDLSQLTAAADDTKESLDLSSRDLSKSKSSWDETLGTLYSQGRTIGTGSKFRYEFDLNGMTVSVYKESIVDVKGVDAIVNAANEQMAHGGGVAYYISKAAGKAMDDEGRFYVVKNGPVPVGKNCVTTAGKLPYKGIIHAVGPQWADYIGQEANCAKDIYLTIKNVLRSTKHNAWRRVALCAISAGIYGVPKELCAEMYIKALADFSEDYVGSVSEIHFVDVNLEILELIKEAHERWRSSPHTFGFKNALKYPSATLPLGRKKDKMSGSGFQRSVYQNPVTGIAPVKYIGQSKTAYDGSSLHQFKIYDVVKVLIYTGSVIKLRVDAIVCSVNSQLVGGLANAVAKEGGSHYSAELDRIKRTWGKKCAHDGYVFITSGGRLLASQVLHVMITEPVTSVNSQALSRLKLVNQCVLEHANSRKIPKLGIPLIGAAIGIIAYRLNDSDTVHEPSVYVIEVLLWLLFKRLACGYSFGTDSYNLEQIRCPKGLLRTHEDLRPCCERFAEDMVEFCKINEKKLHIQEIHIVNDDESRSMLIYDVFRQLESQIRQPNLQTNLGRSVGTQRMSDDFIGSRRESNDKISSQIREIPKTTLTFKTRLDKQNIRCTYYDSCGHNSQWSLKCGHSYCDLCIDLMKDEKCIKCGLAGAGTDAVSGQKSEPSDNCPVCLSDYTNPTTLPCNHRLCKTCLDQVRQHKPCCPVCIKAFGMVTGTQPRGKMTHREIEYSLPGFESCNTIEIFYDFPDGKQGKEHPKPGRRYKGTQRRAFLPNNKEGQTVLKLLNVAFDRRLTFTLGESRTTGKEDTVTWNDIHHKTKMLGGAQGFGYPDPDYLARVKDELAAKGVTEESIQ